MAKVIFEFTDSDAVSNESPGKISIPVITRVGIEGLNDGRPGHSECLALIMKQRAFEILNVINEVYIRELKGSGAFEVNSELLKINEQKGNKNVH